MGLFDTFKKNKCIEQLENYSAKQLNRQDVYESFMRREDT